MRCLEGERSAAVSEEAGLDCSLAVGFGHGKMGEKAGGATGVFDGHREGCGEEAVHTSLQPVSFPELLFSFVFLSFLSKASRYALM